MKRAPSIKSLLRIEGMDGSAAQTIRAYIHGAHVPIQAATSGWDRNERILREANIMLGGFGVECLWDKKYGSPTGCYGHPLISYINWGDPYDCTLLFNYHTQTWRVGCWGDIAERIPESRQI
jgi:hypothetical protein